MSSVAASLLQRLQYHTKPVGVDIALQNLKKLHPSLDDTNPLSIASLVANELLPEQDRDQFREALRILLDREQNLYANYIKKYDDIHRDKNRLPDESERHNTEEQQLSLECSLQSGNNLEE